MPWAYEAASFKGNKTNPQPGDSVMVTLQEPSDPENVETREFTWGYDGSKTKAQFVGMVKAEVKAHLQHLNAASAGEDVTDTFEPD